ncbi:2-amino-4-hydroxy-6-hydroxymethyldihydropteridine diphosphokinase [Deltaproteobacteria bacterium]|nr:2-amino-4-hydroxy-6-hydroxymethyldihydropteridine diphosphokinase [Deltaproteobacteria bacterium]
MTTAILVHLGLGSNLGNRQAFLNQACSKLSAATLQNFRSSEIYESEPLLKMKQSNYFNQVVCGWTELTPVELLEKCQQIETQLGRVRKEHWGSRKIDLDILSYGKDIVDTERIKIPHPEMEKRSFVLLPLLELSPDWVHPKSGKSIQILWENWLKTNNEELPIVLNPKNQSS